MGPGVREDDDFAAYAAARWPTLVRTVVLLGCPPGLAEDVATVALARCRRGWADLRAGDPEVEVRRALLEAWADRRATPWWQGLGPRVPLVVEAELDRLRPTERAVLVLGDAGGLAAGQVAEVLGRDPSYVEGVRRARTIPAAAVLEAAEQVVVPPTPDRERIARRGLGRSSRRPAVVSVLAALVVVLVVAVATWRGTRPEPGPARDTPTADPDVLADAPVVEASNPTGVVWFANGTLHLPTVAVSVGDVTSVASTGTAAVYGDEVGRVVLVDPDGTRTTLGHQRPTDRIVVGRREGWAAWVDPRGEVPELVIQDVVAGEVLARRALPPRAGAGSGEEVEPARAIAVDAGRVYWSDADGVHAWQLSSNTVSGLDPGLLDVSSGVQAFAAGEGLVRIEQPVFAVSVTVAGFGAQLSADGDHVLTQVPRGASGVRIYDTRTGDAVPSGLTARDFSEAATLGPDRAATYIVARVLDSSDPDVVVLGGSWELRTCVFQTRVVDAGCRTLVKVPSAGAAPLLAD